MRIFSFFGRFQILSPKIPIFTNLFHDIHRCRESSNSGLLGRVSQFFSFFVVMYAHLCYDKTHLCTVFWSRTITSQWASRRSYNNVLWLKVCWGKKFAQNFVERKHLFKGFFLPCTVHIPNVKKMLLWKRTHTDKKWCPGYISPPSSISDASDLMACPL